jgi:hypothetical protein
MSKRWYNKDWQIRQKRTENKQRKRKERKIDAVERALDGEPKVLVWEAFDGKNWIPISLQGHHLELKESPIWLRGR